MYDKSLSPDYLVWGTGYSNSIQFNCHTNVLLLQAQSSESTRCQYNSTIIYTVFLMRESVMMAQESLAFSNCIAGMCSLAISYFPNETTSDYTISVFACNTFGCRNSSLAFGSGNQKIIIYYD